MMNQAPDKILVVDDEENILHMFRRTLGRTFDLFTANSADSALEILREHADIAVILSDYHMPGLNGLEFLKLARTISSDSVQIMLTGNIHLDVAIKAINETDIYRYLPKPCPSNVVRKVVGDALEFYHLTLDKQRLTRELEQKNRELAISCNEVAKQKYLLEYELEMAKTVYSKVAACCDNGIDGLDYRIMAKETVGGDFLLSHINTDQRLLYLMLGDLTGHSLQSALAVLLVTEIFDVLCADNLSIEQLAQSINDKMCRKLPTGLFCAALLVKLDLNAQRMHIWQGGVPDAYLLDDQGCIIKTLAANNLPLGVLAEQDFSGSASCHSIWEAASLFVYSDGVTEQMAPDETMFGYQRLHAALQETPSGQRRVDFVIDKLRAYQQQHPQCDDISLFELKLPRICNALENL